MIPLGDSGIATTETRARPRTKARRLALIALATGVLIGSIALLRTTSLHGLPRIPDPFEAYKHSNPPMSEAENAFTFYRQAYDRYVDAVRGSRTKAFTDPSQVTPGLLAHLEANRESLGLWFEGTKRERGALIADLSQVKGEISLDITDRLRNRFSQLANLRAFQLQQQGDYAGAWTWISANLRSSRHASMSGFLVERVIGSGIYQEAAAQAVEWSDDPKLDLSQLRKALADVLVIDELTALASRIILYECVSDIKTLDDPELREQLLTNGTPPVGRTEKIKLKLKTVQGILLNEPERSRRVIRLIAANWLSACDRPAIERRARALKIGKLTLYSPAPDERPAIQPADLARWFESTLYAKLYVYCWPNFENVLARDEEARANLIVHLATQIYKREKGREPSAVEDLVGPYLKTLPVGYVAPSNPKGPSR